MSKYRSLEHSIKDMLESSITGGRYVGSRSDAFRKSSTSKPDDWGDNSGTDVGAARNRAHKKASIDKARESEYTRKKEMAKRTREAEQRKKETMNMAKEDLDEAKIKGSRRPGRSLLNDPRVQRALMTQKALQGKSSLAPKSDDKKEVTKEEAEASGTTERRKIKNVARPDDPNPTSSESKLSKQAEIKTKVIDEGKMLRSDKKFGISDSIIEAAKAVMSGKTEVDTAPETNDYDSDDENGMKKESKHTKPKTAKEKSLAALAHPKDKITHKDVLVGRGVLAKEDVEQIDEKQTHPALLALAKKAQRGIPSNELGADEKKDIDTLASGKATGAQRARTANLLAKFYSNDRAYGPSSHAPAKLPGHKKTVKEDVDLDNDGDVDSSDKYLKNRRKAIGKAMKEEAVTESPADEPINEATHIFHVHLKGAEPRSRRVIDPHSFAGDRRVDDEPAGKEERGSKIILRVKAPTRTKALGAAAKHAAKNYGVDNVRSIVHKGIAEEVEQIDELSRKTLASYIKTAADNVASRTHDLAKAPGMLTKDAEYMDRYQKFHDKTEKRKGMISKAVDRLAKEDVEQVDEVLSKKASAGEWIKDFQSSDNPKFAGKSPEKRKQMALAAYYAKQRNEEVEEVEEAIKPYVSFSGPGQGKVPSATVMGPNEKPHKVFTKAEHGHDYKEKALEYFKKHGKKLREDVEQHRKTHPLPKEFSAEEIARLEEIAKKFN